MLYSFLFPTYVILYIFSGFAMVVTLLVIAREVRAGEIVWHETLTAAFEQAQKSRRIIMVCVNAKFVRSSGRRSQVPLAAPDVGQITLAVDTEAKGPSIDGNAAGVFREG